MKLDDDMPSKNRRAIFILSPPRSGSTLLRVMLGGHPGLVAPPELELLSFENLKERRDSFSGTDSFFLEGAIRAIMGIKDCDAEQGKQIMEAFERESLSTQEFYRIIQTWIGDRLLVDKTPSYAFDLDVLKKAEDYFDQPLYIHLLRHPYAVIRSFEEARLEQVFFRHEHEFSRRELAEMTWLISHQNILEFFKNIPSERRHAVRFEEMVTNSRAVVEEICSFMGLEFHPHMLEPYRDKAKRMTDGIHPESRMLGDVKFHEHDGIDPRTAEQWLEDHSEDFLSEMTWEVAELLGLQARASRNGADRAEGIWSR